VLCQLDTLRRQFPSSIRKTLNELPTSLDETYERTLQRIPKEQRHRVHRLFQCLVAAIRPLRVEELSEIFGIEFDRDTAPEVMEAWRSENPEEAILSVCSTLIAIVDDHEGSKTVRFSHFSVNEFLTSDHIRTSKVGDICNFHIPIDTAHTILARACLTVLLQFDENMDKKRLASFPLAFYAAQNWFNHAKYEGVAPRVQDAMELLFDSRKPYLAAWVWIYDVDPFRVGQSIDTLADRPSHPEATALYYAVSCGLCELAEYLISTRGEDVNAKCGARGTALHAASRKGHLDAVSLLLDHGIDVNITNEANKTPLCVAYDGGHLEVMELLLDHGAAPDMPSGDVGLFLIHYASLDGQDAVVSLLLHHNADVNAAGVDNYTPLHFASSNGHMDVALILLNHGADINAISDVGTSLNFASLCGHIDVVDLLLASGADVEIRAPHCKTPFQVATRMGHIGIEQLLLVYGAQIENV
jgi:ankyrin repeat protein